MKNLLTKPVIIAIMAMCMLFLSNSIQAQLGGTKFNVELYSQSTNPECYRIICEPKDSQLIYGTPNFIFVNDDCLPSYGYFGITYKTVDGIRYMYKDYSSNTPQGLVASGNQFTFRVYGRYNGRSGSTVITTSAKTYNLKIFVGPSGAIKIQ